MGVHGEFRELVISHFLPAVPGRFPQYFDFS